MCHVPPIVRSQQWKLIRCAYKARCPACWLKMCLQSFQMPQTLKTNLTNMLPENMRLSVTQNNDRKNGNISRHTTTTIKTTILNTTNFGSTLVNSNKEKINNSIKNLENIMLPPKKDNDLINNNNNEKERSIKAQLRVRKTDTKPTPPPPVPDNTKRQKLDLKGPRVKHVCRSASIVLGQPVATFPIDNSTQQNEPQTSTVEEEEQTSQIVEENDNLKKNKKIDKDMEVDNNEIPSIPEQISITLDKLLENNDKVINY